MTDRRSADSSNSDVAAMWSPQADRAHRHSEPNSFVAQYQVGLTVSKHIAALVHLDLANATCSKAVVREGVPALEPSASGSECAYLWN